MPASFHYQCTQSKVNEYVAKNNNTAAESCEILTSLSLGCKIIIMIIMQKERMNEDKQPIRNL